MPSSEIITITYKTEIIKDSVKLTVAFEVEDTGKLYLLCGYLENYELEMLMNDPTFKILFNTNIQAVHPIEEGRILWKNLKAIKLKEEIDNWETDL